VVRRPRGLSRTSLQRPGPRALTQGDAERFTRLIDDVSSKIFGTLPDDTWFYPGHGNDSTLGAERPHALENEVLVLARYDGAIQRHPCTAHRQFPLPAGRRHVRTFLGSF
jgi:glyoxylase-like metal-dependent hydrolase (beta-lactamase superfamily II)